MAEPIIDAWIQHPTAAFIRHDMFASLRRWMGLDAIPDEIPVELTLAALDTAGVNRALTSAWWGPHGPLLSNDEVARTVSEHPDRFVGVGSVDLHRPMDAVRELRRCVTELGFVGVRQLPWLWGLPPNDRRYYPIYAECVELGVPFCLQVGHAGPLRPSDPGRPIPYLDEVACEFPELRIVGGHIGYPWTEEMVSLATKYENVYIDTSAYTPERYPEALVRFMKGPGRRKVLFGSNFPMIQPSKCIAQLDSLGLSDDVRRLFLSENARKVFELDF
ncbi:MAG: amidohydrolase [Deltaproteobacteria bacterium]|nr:amidohydrolase family protein [Deltaproteobacteria bacterium]NNK44450.1 amidohydrolase [Myxococcales bacterium]RZV51353.1 MAG: amidohydrolase [Deltaproteobacteria bacterium]